MPNPIPYKGVVLTADLEVLVRPVPRLAARSPPDLGGRGCSRRASNISPSQLRGRTMLVRKVEVLPIECVVRGYLAGSGWKEYQSSGTVCGIQLPAGLQQCQQLPEPIFTPATRPRPATTRTSPLSRRVRLVGRRSRRVVRDKSIDTLRPGGASTPASAGSSWPTRNSSGACADGRDDPDRRGAHAGLSAVSGRRTATRTGRDQESFDKQFVRNYLQRLCDEGRWDKTEPAPTSRRKSSGRRADGISRRTSGSPTARCRFDQRPCGVHRADRLPVAADRTASFTPAFCACRRTRAGSCYGGIGRRPSSRRPRLR